MGNGHLDYLRLKFSIILVYICSFIFSYIFSVEISKDGTKVHLFAFSTYANRILSTAFIGTALNVSICMYKGSSLIEQKRQQLRYIAIMNNVNRCP